MKTSCNIQILGKWKTPFISANYSFPLIFNDHKMSCRSIKTVLQNLLLVQYALSNYSVLILLTGSFDLDYAFWVHFRL